jgi:tetratricopeptide (TPR) repeat protein
MPGVEIETVTLDENIGHPLDAVLGRVDRSKRGPLMIVGLEKSNPSSAKERPVLYALNMSRPEWPKELPRPIVFWVPEYMLGLMGREAPDFLDWRSDTLFFPEHLGDEVIPLASSLWAGGKESSLSEQRRRARISELQARLAGLSPTEDKVIQGAVADWHNELGNHHFTLGELQQAESHYLQALQAFESLGEEEAIAGVRMNLANIYSRWGEFARAGQELDGARLLYEALKNPRGVAAALGNLASLALLRGSSEDAERFSHDAIALSEELEDDEEISFNYVRLSTAARYRGDLQEAERYLRKALEISGERNKQMLAGIFQNLGIVFLGKGDLAEAAQFLEKAFAIAEELGDREAVADIYVSLGVIALTREGGAAAERFWQAAHDLYAQAGMTPKLEALRRMMESAVPS